MEKIGVQVAALMALENDNANSFAKKIGSNRQTVTNIIQNVNKPSAEFIELLQITYPNLSMDWLYSGLGPMWKGEKSVTPVSSGNNSQANANNRVHVGGNTNNTSNVDLLQAEIGYLKARNLDLENQKLKLEEKNEKLEAKVSELYADLLKTLGKS